MRLWHETLLPLLPREQLLGQHRECCALRGLSWGKRHAIVDYVFEHPREYLVAYHQRVMQEMARRGYQTEQNWRDASYCGIRCPPCDIHLDLLEQLQERVPIFPEHDEKYWNQCVDNLRGKGVYLTNSYKKEGWRINEYTES
jgi:uncharacterized protein (TIGR02328 family)